MPDFVKWLRELETRWGTRTGLVLALILSGAVLIWIFGTVDFSKIKLWHLVVICAVWAMLVITWRVTTLPRVPRGKIGFGIAIRYEDAKERATVQSDFAEKLRELIQASDYLRHKFHFVEFNDRISRRFIDSENPGQLARRANAHFVFYGTAKSRVIADGPSYVLELHGLVRHAQLDADVQLRFGAEFVGVLPSRVIIKEPNSLLGFEFAARHFDIVARYIIGTAAALSGDFGYAEQLLLDARQRLDGLAAHGGGAMLASMRSKIPARLSELYEVLLGQSVQRYTLKREPDALLEAGRIIAQRRRCGLPDTYGTSLCAAICAFMQNRDLATARRELEPCKKVDDCSWRYSDPRRHLRR